MTFFSTAWPDAAFLSSSGMRWVFAGTLRRDCQPPTSFSLFLSDFFLSWGFEVLLRFNLLHVLITLMPVFLLPPFLFFPHLFFSFSSISLTLMERPPSKGTPSLLEVDDPPPRTKIE